MIVALLTFFNVASGLSLRHKFTLKMRADPYCKTGIVDSTMHACCPKSCSACDDQGDSCQAAELACCPSAVTANQDDILEKRSCDDTNPPCVLGDEYRNPPAADALDALANTKIHARDDCNKVIPATQHQLYLSSHFAKKTGVAIGSDKCISGGPYETLEEAGRACGKDDLCKGFTVVDDKPDCLFSEIGLTSEDPLAVNYFKVKDMAGNTVSAGQEAFAGPSDQVQAGLDAEEDTKFAEATAKIAKKNEKKLTKSLDAAKAFEGEAVAAEETAKEAATKAEEFAEEAKKEAEETGRPEAAAKADAAAETAETAKGELEMQKVQKEEAGKMAEAAQKEKEAAGEATRAAEDAASASAEAETAAKDATDADAAVAAAEDSAAALADGIKNSPPIGYSYVEGGDNHHCGDLPTPTCACIACGKPEFSGNMFPSGACGVSSSGCSATTAGAGCYSTDADHTCDCATGLVKDYEGGTRGDVKACAAKCDADVTCHFFTYFHDDGCRIYTTCDSKEQPDWLPGVGSTIFQRTPTYFMAPQYVENSGGDWGEVTCDAGLRVTGGGCQAHASPHIMQANRPTDAGNAWQCGGHSGAKKRMALCSDIPTKIVFKSGGDWDEAVCPEGSVAIGGGCNARASPFIMEKASVSKSLKKYKCGGSGAPKDVYAICAFDDGKFERVESKGGDWHVVDCPAGTVVVSGGCRAYKSPHKFEYNGPFGNGWKCGGHGGKKKVWAVCHKQD
jgi:hypothetical protein